MTATTADKTVILTNATTKFSITKRQVTFNWTEKDVSVPYDGNAHGLEWESNYKDEIKDIIKIKYD